MGTATPTIDETPSALQTWWLAIRPRTLPAAVAPIAVGGAVAWREDGFHLLVVLCALAVALALQVLANLANDLGDFHRGADVARVGPTRVTQGGLVTPEGMKRAIALVIALAIVPGLYLVWQGGWPFLLLGLAAILAALAYTVGPFPLGYHGLGELFVFLFFGLAGVTGTAVLQTHDLTRLSLLAAVPVGLLVVNIIVVNNLRDIATDLVAGKHTVATRIGRDGTILEYRLLLVASYLVPFLLWATGDIGWGAILPLASLPLAVPLFRAIGTTTGPALNPVLGKTAQLALVFSILFAIGILP